MPISRNVRTAIEPIAAILWDEGDLVKLVCETGLGQGPLQHGAERSETERGETGQAHEIVILRVHLWSEAIEKLERGRRVGRKGGQHFGRVRTGQISPGYSGNASEGHRR